MAPLTDRHGSPFPRVPQKRSLWTHMTGQVKRAAGWILRNRILAGLSGVLLTMLVSWSAIRSTWREWTTSPVPWAPLFETGSFNVLVLPFGPYGSCEAEGLHYDSALRDRLLTLQGADGVSLDVRVLDTTACFLTYDQALGLARCHRAHIVVWGNYETRCDWDSTLINIRFTSVDTIAGAEVMSSDSGLVSIRDSRSFSRGVVTGRVEDFANLVLALEFQRRGSFKRSLDRLRRIETPMRSEYTDLLFTRAWLSFEVGEVDSAKHWYRQGLTLDSSHAVPWSNLGNALYSQDSMVLALECYRNSLRIDPLNPNSLALAAEVLSVLGRQSEADSAFRDAFGKIPDDATLLLNWANHKHRSGQFEEEFAIVERILLLNPRHAAAYFKRGTLFLQETSYEAALADINKAIELGGLHAPFLHQRASILIRMEEDELALDVLNMLEKEGDTSCMLFQNKGIALMHLQHFTDAEDYLLKALQMCTGAERCHVLQSIGLLYGKMHQHGLARDYLRQALGCNPADRVSQKLLKLTTE